MPIKSPVRKACQASIWPLLTSAVLLVGEDAHGASIRTKLGQNTLDQTTQVNFDTPLLTTQNMYDFWEIKFSVLRNLDIISQEFNTLQQEIAWEYLFLENFEYGLQLATAQENEQSFDGQNPLASLPIQRSIPPEAQNFPAEKAQDSSTEKAQNSPAEKAQSAQPSRVKSGKSQSTKDSGKEDSKEFNLFTLFAELSSFREETSEPLPSENRGTVRRGFSVAPPTLSQTSLSSINDGLYEYDSKTTSASSRPRSSNSGSRSLRSTPGRTNVNPIIQASGPIGFGSGVTNTFGGSKTGLNSAGIPIAFSVGVRSPFGEIKNPSSTGYGVRSPNTPTAQRSSTTKTARSSNAGSSIATGSRAGTATTSSQAVTRQQPSLDSARAPRTLGLPPLSLGKLGPQREPNPLSSPLPVEEIEDLDDLGQLNLDTDNLSLPLALEQREAGYLGELVINTNFALMPGSELQAHSSLATFVYEQNNNPTFSNSLLSQINGSESADSLLGASLTLEARRIAEEQQQELLEIQREIEEELQERLEEQQREAEERLAKLQAQIEERQAKEAERIERLQASLERKQERLGSLSRNHRGRRDGSNRSSFSSGRNNDPFGFGGGRNNDPFGRI